MKLIEMLPEMPHPVDFNVITGVSLSVEIMCSNFVDDRLF
jgi:hypothetical protein